MEGCAMRSSTLRREPRPGSASRLRLHGPADLPALRTVRPPLGARRVAVVLLVGLFVLTVLFLLVPWQRSVRGVGRVVAYAPADREQVVDAPVDARIASWEVEEGEEVVEGQPLVRLIDNDPSLIERLEGQRAAAVSAMEAARAQEVSYAAVAEAAAASRELLLAEYDSRLRGLERQRVGEQVALEMADRQQTRLVALRAEGIAAPRDLELSEVALAQSLA